MGEQDPRQFARNLRNNATPAERVLWTALSRMRPRFTRQLRIKPHVGDFACRRARLVVECDGSQHADGLSDAMRTGRLERQGWKVIRFWNNEILANLEGLIQVIVEEVQARLPEGENVAFISSRAGRIRTPRSRKKDHP
jgi:very-short-patch-repair endonuclease